MVRGREEYRNQEITEGTGKVGKGSERYGEGMGRKVDIKKDVFLFIKFREGTQKKLEGWRRERIKKLKLFTTL